jgi:hypothetical protein
MAAGAIPRVLPLALKLTQVAAFSGMRVLYWDNGFLYASSGYELYRTKPCPDDNSIRWQRVAACPTGLWRKCTSSFPLASRLFRDGFHALTVLSSGRIIGAVSGRILTLAAGETEFRTTHRLLRGRRPLHITKTLHNHLVWGEYFDNPDRAEVHIYGSTDGGEHWYVAYTFPKRTIRHIHNVVYDRWQDCYWVLTGDLDSESRILRASLDFSTWDTVLTGNQQARSAALIPTQDALYFTSDTPLEPNYIYRLDRRGKVDKVAALTSSSIYGCRVGDSIFFSTMVEPSPVNRGRQVCLFGSSDGLHWNELLHCSRDSWPMKFFQYGNAFLPDGENESGFLALSTVAVKDAKLSMWRVT